MGKVLNTFGKMFPGTVSHSADDIIISVKNATSSAIKPGDAVFLASGGGCTPIRPGSVFEEFIGIAVRPATKAPSNYVTSGYADSAVQAGNKYEGDDMVDVLVRGCVAVALETDATVAGGEVHINLSDGTYATEEEEDVTIQLENCSWRISTPASNGYAEIVIRERNLL